MVSRADFSVVQSVFADVFEKRQTFEVRLDILNVGNLINKNSGPSATFRKPPAIDSPDSSTGRTCQFNGGVAVCDARDQRPVDGPYI